MTSTPPLVREPVNPHYLITTWFAPSVLPRNINCATARNRSLHPPPEKGRDLTQGPGAGLCSCSRTSTSDKAVPAQLGASRVQEVALRLFLSCIMDAHSSSSNLLIGRDFHLGQSPVKPGLDSVLLKGCFLLLRSLPLSPSAGRSQPRTAGKSPQKKKKN